MVAEHADVWHCFGDAATIAHKCDVLDRWCAQVGREPEAIERSTASTEPRTPRPTPMLAAGVTLFTLGVDGPTTTSGRSRNGSPAGTPRTPPSDGVGRAGDRLDIGRAELSIDPKGPVRPFRRAR